VPATLAVSTAELRSGGSRKEWKQIMTFTASSTESGPQPVGASAPRGRPTRAIAFTALVASAAMAGLGLVWLLAPDLNPFGNGEMPSLLSKASGPTAVAGVALALGLTGVALAVVFVLGGRASQRAIAGFGAAALALLTGLTLGSMGIIAFAGYLFGLAAVVAGVATIAVMLVRTPRLGLLLLTGLIALIGTAVWLAGLTADGVFEFAVAFSGALAAEAPNLAVVAVVVIATLTWAVIAITALRFSPAGRPFEAWLVRHRRSLTILAALGPVPYAVARSSWLTPWPLFGPAAEDLAPSMLATGLMLGAGAAAASTLTLGLILPWGRRFPRWMPRIGGHSVPVAAAVVPGSIAAGVLCISAAPMLVTVVGNPGAPVDALLVNLVLPLWFWGPMLALAVWAYAAWRWDEAHNA
jgi:hypothetical protein